MFGLALILHFEFLKIGMTQRSLQLAGLDVFEVN
jgi:hypothetical protein